MIYLYFYVGASANTVSLKAFNKVLLKLLNWGSVFQWQPLSRGKREGRKVTPIVKIFWLIVSFTNLVHQCTVYFCSHWTIFLPNNLGQNFTKNFLSNSLGQGFTKNLNFENSENMEF